MLFHCISCVRQKDTVIVESVTTLTPAITPNNRRIALTSNEYITHQLVFSTDTSSAPVGSDCTYLRNLKDELPQVIINGISPACDSGVLQRAAFVFWFEQRGEMGKRF